MLTTAGLRLRFCSKDVLHIFKKYYLLPLSLASVRQSLNNEEKRHAWRIQGSESGCKPWLHSLASVPGQKRSAEVSAAETSLACVPGQEGRLGSLVPVLMWYLGASSPTAFTRISIQQTCCFLSLLDVPGTPGTVTGSWDVWTAFLRRKLWSPVSWGQKAEISACSEVGQAGKLERVLIIICCCSYSFQNVQNRLAFHLNFPAGRQVFVSSFPEWELEQVSDLERWFNSQCSQIHSCDLCYRDPTLSISFL